MGYLIHLDTDIGGDTDDLVALAFLLTSRGVEIAGVTTVTELQGGKRAGCVRRALHLARREDVEVAAGVEGSLSGFRMPPGLADEDRYWPEPIEGCPSPAGAATELLLKNIERGATIVAIGPCTNLALLEITRPGSLAAAKVVLMGGLIEPPAEGLPNWGHEMDYNVQQDTMAARVVFDGCDPIIVPMDVTLRAWLRRAHLAELRGGGQLASLVASQAELHASDHKMAELASTWRALPDDLLNFMHDPLACAIACGWEGAELRSIGLRYAVRDGLGRFEPDASGKRTQVCRGLDGPRFEKLLISTVTAEPATPRPSPCS